VRFAWSLQLAIQYHFGIRCETVWRWRHAFDVEKLNKGSAWLRLKLNRGQAARRKGKRLPAAVVKRMSDIALAEGRRYPNRWKDTGWTKMQLRLLGTAPDEEIAARIGRTANAVRVMRTRLKIATVGDKRRSANKK
jgi:hypothetical protein